jgi:cysteine-S-conjugate beta-lyase
MPLYDFDEVIPRRGSYSAKWTVYPEDVIPMWVADMDFKSPPAVMERLHGRIDEGHFGYTMDYPELRESIVERMKRLYGWEIQTEDLVFIPGMVLALNVCARTVGKDGDGVLMQTPVYGPFLSVPPVNERFAMMVDMVPVSTGDNTFSYEIDFDAFEKAVTRQTTSFYLCNPHNPAGRVLSRSELEQLADICMRHNVIICADEIHSDLLLNGNQHVPIASLSPEIAQKTITLIAPSKTFNLPGLACSVAIIPDKDLRLKFEQNARSLGVHVNIMGLESATAAYQHGDDWLKHLLVYLQGNRDLMVDFIRDNIPSIKTTVPEATYLAWLDCRALTLPPVDAAAGASNPFRLVETKGGQNAQEFFLAEAKVALNPGTFFGTGYEMFTRLNFACPRSILMEGLERMKAAVDKL